MPGQPDNLKRRKRKRSSEAKSSRKASATRRKCLNSPKTHSAAESSLAVGGQSKAAGSVERLSHISCECHQSTGRRRCSASPELSGQDGKENELKMELDLHSCRVNHIQDKQEDEEMDYEDTGKHFFPDDDSNQILPVEQFFGNLDAVQDFPQRSPATSANVQRENRRRHYYAREDSDEEEVGLSGVQRDDRGGT
uniref:Chromosome 7 C1orf174 homolog n=2 Tax=Mastacembelus armatus TaxID=205130 RepID=A0A7N9AR00_9TELE